MGWTLDPKPWAYNAVTEVWHGPDRTPIMTRHSWRPDEDDTQNMQVLDRMVSLGFSYQVRMHAGVVTVSFWNDEAKPAETSHADRRHAVLLAALSAVKTSPHIKTK